MRKKYDKRYKKISILFLDDVIHTVQFEDDISIGDSLYVNKIYFDHNDDCPCIPFTAMSLSEYQSLKLPFVPDYSLIANGSILLHEDHMIAAWSQLVKNMLKDYISDMENVVQSIADIDLIYPPDNVQSVNGSFILIKTQYVDPTYSQLQKTIDLTKMDIHIKENRIYVIPKKLDKNILIKNFGKYVKTSKIIRKGVDM